MDFYQYIRCCAICKKYYPPTDWLCEDCWKNLKGEYLSFQDVYRAEKTLPHWRLLDWHSDNYFFIQRFISSLKQGGPFFIFKKMGLDMFSRFVHHALWQKKEQVVFIPSPAKNKPFEDHAYLLAKALNYYFGGELKPILKIKNPQSHQKAKTRLERSAISFLKTESISPEKTIVLVDDVLTTGATARSIYRALNQPKNFFIFTLAWKRYEDLNPDE